MNTKKFKSKLNKITTIFESMQADQSISSLEQELLKKYVVQLYETLIDHSSEVDQADQPKREEKKEKLTPVKVEEPKQETRVEEAHSIHVEETIERPEPKVSPTAVVKPIVEKVAIAETLQHAVPAAAVATASQATSTVIENKLEMSPELEPIFEKIEATELSDRLSISKVKDIGKSMGINEKIFTIKELFAGDQTLFNSVVSKLDACTSYEEAAQYLSSTIARDQKWGEASKAKKAKTFVKLVQRKFV